MGYGLSLRLGLFTEYLLCFRSCIFVYTNYIYLITISRRQYNVVVMAVDATVRKTWIKILALSSSILKQEVTNKQGKEVKMIHVVMY